ncbi:MAG: DUF917 domain-containing protein [Thermoplasmata archaeon]
MIIDSSNIDYLLDGLSFFAAGGGGLKERGRERLLAAIRKKGRIEVTDPEDLDQSMLSACTFYMGSASPDTDLTIRKRSDYGFINVISDNPIREAVLELENHIEEGIGSIISLETGAGATSGSLAAASDLGIFPIDGDYAGRSIPEIYQTTPFFGKFLFHPMSAVDRFGNRIIISEVKSVFSLERIGKMLSESSYTSLGMAGIVMKVGDLKDIYIKGTVSRAVEVGKIISTYGGSRLLNELDNIVPVQQIFEGKLIGREWQDRDGYMEGNHVFEGVGDFSGRIFRIWFRNENHIGFLDDEVIITSPDLIVVLRKETNEPLNNTTMQENINVRILGVQADKKMRVKEALEVLGPRHFGFDFDYVPFR